jgi:hypothetical protein
MLKRVFVFTLAASVILSLAPGKALASSFKWPWDRPGGNDAQRPGNNNDVTDDGALSGNGSERTPYLIYDEADLALIGTNSYSTGANYQLKNDIRLRQTWTPIPTFSGIFDGNGCTVSNVRVNSNRNNDYVGLFYSNTGAIMALGVEVAVSADAPNSSAGAITGYNSGTITQCYSLGRVSCRGYAVGGIAGTNVGVIRNCYSQADITGAGGTFAGGVTGAASDRSVIATCYSAGRIRGSDHAGGIVGYAYSGRVQDSYYDSGRAGKVTNDQGKGLSSDEMRSESSFRGFDFRRMWIMGRSYPDLRVFV